MMVDERMLERHESATAIIGSALQILSQAIANEHEARMDLVKFCEASGDPADAEEIANFAPDMSSMLKLCAFSEPASFAAQWRVKFGHLNDAWEARRRGVWDAKQGTVASGHRVG